MYSFSSFSYSYNWSIFYVVRDKLSMYHFLFQIQSMGLGGGFLMTIWDAKSGTADYLDARETAPAAAEEKMFHGNAHLSMYGK